MTHIKAIASEFLLLLLLPAAGLALIADTHDIRASAEQDHGCVFWSHTDNRAFWTGTATVTREGITCPDKTVTRTA